MRFRDGDPFHVAFGEAVRVERTRQNMTQDDLAKAVRLTRTSITNIEAGRQRPLLYQACEIAQALSVPMDALMKQCLEAVRRDEIEQLTARLAELQAAARSKAGGD